MGKAFAQAFEFDMTQNVAHECLLENQTGLALGNAALAHIEEGRFVEFANGAAVITLDIVGINLQHRLAESACGGCGTDIRVGLLREALLRALFHEHQSRKCADAMAIKHIFIEHIARATGRSVVHHKAVVHALLPIGHDHSACHHIGSLAIEAEVEAVACLSAGEGHAVVGNVRRGGLVHVHIIQGGVLLGGFFHGIHLNVGSFAHEDFGHLRGERAALPIGMFAKEDDALRALLGHNEQAAVDHQVGARCGHIDDLNGIAQDGASGQIYQQSVLRQEGVESRHTIILAACFAIVIGSHERGVGLREGLNEHALGQGCRGRLHGIGHIVHHEVERRTQVGHGAAVLLVGVNSGQGAAQVEPIVGRKGGLHVGVFVPLVARGGQPVLLQARQSSLTSGIHRCARGTAERFALSGIEVEVLLKTGHRVSSYGLCYSSTSSLIQSNPRSSMA